MSTASVHTHLVLEDESTPQDWRIVTTSLRRASIENGIVHPLTQIVSLSDKVRPDSGHAADPVTGPGAATTVEPIAYEAIAVGGVSESGVRDINGLIYGVRWDGVIRFDFPDFFSEYGADAHTVDSFQLVALQQRTALCRILEGLSGIVGMPTAGSLFGYGSFEAVSSVVLTEQGTNDPTDLSIALAGEFDGTLLATSRVADFPRLDQRSDGGDVWFSTGDPGYGVPLPGSVYWHAHLRTLGLKDRANAGYGQFLVSLTYDHNGMEFSVMTARSNPGADPSMYQNETYGYAQMLMIDLPLNVQPAALKLTG